MNKCNVPKKKANYNFNFCKNLINNQKQPSRDVLQFCSSAKIAQQRVCFPVNFQKKFKTVFLQNTSRQLLPNNVGSTKKKLITGAKRIN